MDKQYVHNLHRKELKLMPREKEAYRDNLERICEKFPVRELLTIGDVCAFLGCSRNNKVIKSLPFKNRYISKATLARALCPK